MVNGRERLRTAIERHFHTVVFYTCEQCQDIRSQLEYVEGYINENGIDCYCGLGYWQRLRRKVIRYAYFHIKTYHLDTPPQLVHYTSLLREASEASLSESASESSLESSSDDESQHSVSSQVSVITVQSQDSSCQVLESSQISTDVLQRWAHND